MMTFELKCARWGGIVSRRFIQRTVLTALLCGAASVVPSALAVSFGFDLVFNRGDLAGQTFSGAIETTPGDGLKTAANGGLLSFSATVDGETFSELDDVNYPFFPEVEIAVMGSQIVFVDYRGDKNFTDPQSSAFLQIFFDAGFENTVFYISPSGLQFGEGTFVQPQNVPETVPTLALLSIAVSGIMVVSGRRQSHANGFRTA